MIKYLTMTIGKQKNMALIAHDGKKQDMLKWCMENKVTYLIRMLPIVVFQKKIKKFYSNIICPEPERLRG